MASHIPPAPTLIEILRSTLLQMQTSHDFDPDDPAVQELKNHIVRAIAEMEVAKSKTAA
jgi:hypothetical protein